MDEAVLQAAEWIKHSEHCIVFTGSGISVESGIPPFRGAGGLWNEYDPQLFDIGYFRAHPETSWAILKKLFFDLFGRVKPNAAHRCTAELEKKGYVKAVITQNIDNLHQEAGSRKVYEFHGSYRTLSCMQCGFPYDSQSQALDVLPPLCSQCRGVLKPDFVFFGEGIPEEAHRASFREAGAADVVLVIGTTGEVMPACRAPYTAKENGAKIIEINIEPSNFTPTVTDLFLRGKAGEVMPRLLKGMEID